MTAVPHPRALICIIVAIAMTFASVASAWAVSVNVGRGFPQQQTSISHKAMPDCERMAHASKADAPDGKHESCADNFCMAKCFKVFGCLQADELAVTMALSPHPFPLRLPAIWFDQPPFAPPRS